MTLINYYSSPLEQFEILIFYPLFFLGILDLSITNSMVMLFIIFMVILMIYKLTFFQNYLISKSFFNSLFESFYGFIFGMIKQQAGIFGQNYFPYFLFLFLIILLSNLFGLLPYSFTVTGHIIITFFLALSFNISFFLFALNVHGLKFFNLFVPKDAPVFLIPLLVVIETLSYLLRTLSLSIRLFANMMAGHTLMFILSSFILSFLEFGVFGVIPAFLTFSLLFSIFILEVGIAFLQAYVFVILLSIYLRDAVSPSH